MKIVVCTVGLLASVALAVAVENEVWISATGPNNTGTTVAGTPNDPFRCTDSASLNTVLTLRIPQQNCTIHFMPGTFITTGITLQPGWKLRGGGIDNTTVKLQDNCSLPSGAIYVIGNTASFVKGAEVSDLTVDCNLQNQTSTYCMEAVHMGGSFTRISGVKAINWGTTVSREEFILMISDLGTGTPMTNCVVENCIITQPAQVTFASGSFVGGINIGIGGDPYTGRDAVARGNLVLNVVTGSGGPGSPPGFYGMGAFSGSIVNNRFMDLPGAIGVYHDTTNISDVLIEGNLFHNVSLGVWFNIPGVHVDGLVIRNNTFRVASGGSGIECYTGDTNNLGGYGTNVVISGNTIYPARLATNSTALNLSARLVGTVMNNVLQGSDPSGWDFYVLGTYSPIDGSSSPYPYLLDLRTFSDNVNLKGLQLKVGEYDGWRPDSSSTIEFKPTSGGWWRLYSNSQGAGTASVSIKTGGWNTPDWETDVELWFWVATDSVNPGGIQLTRGRPFGSPQDITKARIANDWPNNLNVYFDIYVPSAPPARGIRVTVKGPFRNAFLTSPTWVPDMPAPLHETDLTF